MEKNKIDRLIDIIKSHLNEEMPTMALGHGKIAGTAEAGDNPPVKKEKRKYAKAGPGSRKIWLDYLKNK